MRCAYLALFALLVPGVIAAVAQTPSSRSSGAPTATNRRPTLPPGPGKDIVAVDCTGCHTTERIVSRRQTAQQWAATVDEMISQGASLTPEQKASVVRYLADHFGPPTTSTTSRRQHP